MWQGKWHWLLALLLPLAAVLAVACSGAELPAGTKQATFIVHCYDVGADALMGRPGVLAVGRGWQDLHEVDRVSFDPQRVSVEELEAWLREAGTYVRTLEIRSGPVPVAK